MNDGLYDLFKTVHVLAAAAWFGGGVMVGILAKLVGDQMSPVASAKFGRAAEKLTRGFFMPMAIITLVFGIALVLKSDGGWSFGDPFVSFGFLVVIASAIIGPLKIAPANKGLVEVLESEPFDPAAVPPAVKQVRLWSIANTALVFLAIIAMTYKVGA